MVGILQRALTSRSLFRSKVLAAVVLTTMLSMLSFTVAATPANTVRITEETNTADQISIVEELPLPHKTEWIPTSLLPPGKEKVLIQGIDGLQRQTYRTANDTEERQILSQEVLRTPVDEKVLIGEQSAPISSLDFGYELDENGEPIAYTQVLREQRAAGYSARPGALTASGRKAAVGYVAVNPNVIPYGSKLFIKSADNSFVYGYAIASDTGTALQNGTIAVDLFYGSYLESALNGIRYVDIYVLESE